MAILDTLKAAATKTAFNGLSAWERVSSGVTFNVFDPRYHSNPFPMYTRLREHDPVHWSPAIRCWVVSRYDDVLAALRDPRMSADERNNPGFDKMIARARKRGDIQSEEGSRRWIARGVKPLASRASSTSSWERSRRPVAWT